MQDLVPATRLAFVYSSWNMSKFEVVELNPHVNNEQPAFIYKNN